MLGKPVWYDNYGYGFLPEYFWQYLPHKTKRKKHLKLHRCFHTKEKASMAQVSGSRCHETSFGSCLLNLLANRSKSGVPNVFLIYLKTTVLSFHFLASCSSLEYKSTSTLLQPGMSAAQIHRFHCMPHSQISFVS